MFKRTIKSFRYLRLKNKSNTFFGENQAGNMLSRDPGLRTLTQWYSNEILSFSNRMNDFERQNRMVSSCKKGCVECCRQAIYISPAEYDILKYNIVSLNLNVKKQIKYKSKAICNRIRYTTIPMKFSRAMTSKEQRSINKQYFEKNLMCPLVGENNQCLIYPIRPLVCFTYRSYGDRAECATTYTPDFAHAYIACDASIRSKLESSYLPKSDDYRLLVAALNEILKKTNIKSK